MAKNNQEEDTDQVQPKSLLKRVVWSILLFLFSLIFLFSCIFVFLGWRFSKLTGLSTQEVFTSVWSGFKDPYHSDYLTFLILGLDVRENDSALLTDTIILITVDTSTGDYLLFSIPRDLWLADLQTKINALYYYGHKQDPENGTKLIKQKIEEILDWPIDYVMVFSMEQVKELIDSLGGVKVEVEREFTDKHYPKDDGTGEVKVIRFRPGEQVFSGERALEYMRSRQSEDEVEGTDEARQKRQKKVILAIQNKLLSQKSSWLNLNLVASLFNFATRKVETSPPLDLTTLSSFWRVGKAVISEGKATELELSWREIEAMLSAQREANTQAWILVPREGHWDAIADYFKQALP